ncbi:LacI family DNA-binding transcriptional regulator [Curtobacterium sp. Csp2]|nr:LacI family DNA-binding transcriptional regulator [Curtobacterium sp. Csp2]
MVAERAGTSIATVSLVVNGKDRGRVSAPIAARVRDAVDELGYVVDHAASSLARGTGDLVVLIAPDLSNPFFAEVIRGVRDTLGDRYQLVLSVTERGAQPATSDLRRFERLRPAGILVDAPDAPTGAVAVDYDLTSGVAELVAHLRERGHERVAYLDGTARVATFGVRHRLFQEACAAAGITVSELGARADLTVDAAAAATEHALEAWHEDGVTAVVAAADTLAYGVLRVAAATGLRVPEDLAVAGFDDLPSSSVTAPALTSVALPGAELGRAAALRLLAAVDGTAAEPVALPTRLVRRASTGG